MEVTNFGKLVNSGKLISDNNTIIKSPAINTEHPTLQTLEEIKNIKEAIESGSDNVDNRQIKSKTFHISDDTNNDQFDVVVDLENNVMKVNGTEYQNETNYNEYKLEYDFEKKLDEITITHEPDYYREDSYDERITIDVTLQTTNDNSKTFSVFTNEEDCFTVEVNFAANVFIIGGHVYYNEDKYNGYELWYDFEKKPDEITITHEPIHHNHIDHYTDHGINATILESKVTATVNDKTVEATLDANNKVTSLTVDGKKCDITESEDTTSFTVTNASNDSEIFTATTEDNTTYNISGIGTVTLDCKDYHKLLANLEDVAIDNSNGTIVFKYGSTIDDINKTEGIDPIIQGGTIDISDLIDWSSNSIVQKNNTPHLSIKSAFYNVNIKLIPDTLTDTSTLITYFNDNAKFDSDDKYLFQNMKFFSNIKGDPVVTRRSTVSMPVGLSISAEVTENKAKYNTAKPVISTAYFNSDNVLKLFYPVSEITEEFKANPPLVVDSTALSVSLYELLNDPSSYISGISVTESTKQLDKDYGLDLIPFVKNDKNVIDYSKFDENGNTNLNKIQFVSDKNETNSLDLTLLPSYVMDDETKVEDTTIDMKSTYDGWEGLIDPSSYKIKLNAGTYKIKTHEYLAIETTGNVDLYIDNGSSNTLSLCELSNSGGTLQVFQNNYKKENENQLTIKLVTRDYKIPSDSTVIINAPMSVHFVKDDLIHTKKVYNEIKDLINDYIKAKIDYNALADKTEAGATDGITAKYSAISSVINSKLNDISNMLTEIEVSTSTTDYAKYFQKIDENDGKIPDGITGIKSYNEIKTIQNELIQINRYKIEVLKDYLGVLNHYVGTLDGDPKTEVQDKKETISTNISKAKTNQVKMLKNKYYNVTDATEQANLATEITELSGATFPPAAG